MEFKDQFTGAVVTRKLSSIVDGVSKTLLVTEMAASPEFWRAKQRMSTMGGGEHGWAFVFQGTEFDSWELSKVDPSMDRSPGPCAVNCQNRDEIYGFHPGGVNAVFCDGHVGFINESIEVRIMAALVTREGREKITEEY
jgi:prepilin-type processing-associated H-X9-DG protein